MQKTEGGKGFLLPGKRKLISTAEKVEMIIWFGLLVPKGTPQEIIDKLYAAQKRGFNEKRMPPVIEKIGMIPYLTTPQEVDRIIKEPHELYSRAAQEFGFEVK